MTIVSNGKSFHNSGGVSIRYIDVYDFTTEELFCIVILILTIMYLALRSLRKSRRLAVTYSRG